MIKRSLPLLFVLLLPIAAADAGRRAVTHEDVWLMRRVGSPVASPDGTRVVFSVTIPAYEAKAQTSDLWIVPVDGSAEPRQITHDKATESGVAWSHDSARIAFSAKRTLTQWPRSHFYAHPRYSSLPNPRQEEEEAQ